MVSTSAPLGIALVALGLVLTPRPNVIYLVSRSITQGRRAGCISLVLGITQIGIALSVNALIVVFAGGLAQSLSTRPT